MLITARGNNECWLGLELLKASLNVDTLKKGDIHKNGHGSYMLPYEYVDTVEKVLSL